MRTEDEALGCRKSGWWGEDLAVISKAKRMVRTPVRWASSLERIWAGRRLKPDPASIQSVLVLEYMLPLGCLVHMTPVFEALKAERPDLTVMVATHGLGAALHRHNPRLDYVLDSPDVLIDTLGALRALRRKLKQLGVKPDCVLTGASDKRTRIALLGALLGAGWRGGYTLMPELYQRTLEYHPEKSLIDNNLQLAGLVGCGFGHREPKVYFSTADVSAAEALVRETNPAGKPLVVMVTQGSGGQRTGWRAERFAEVVRYAAEVLGCSVVFAGIQKDRTAIEGLRAIAGGIGTSVAGRTTVTELAALLAMSDAMVSLDTGTMHMGRAVGVPMVVIGPSWQKPLEWLPLGLPKVTILRGDDRVDIPEGYQLDEVEAGAVCQALAGLMLAHPASAQSRAERVRACVSDIDHRLS